MAKRLRSRHWLPTTLGKPSNQEIKQAVVFTACRISPLTSNDRQLRTPKIDS
jgi:hypothetical protein